VFARSAIVNIVLSLLFVVSFGACGGASGCQGCASQPLPGGKLPADQTVEGGGQIRVTQSGFNKLQSLVPGLLNSGFANGFCIPKTRFAASDICYESQGQCSPGCKVNLHLNSTQLAVTNDQTLNVKIDLNVSVPVRINPPLISACTMTVTADSLKADLDIAFGIDAATGELKINLVGINDLDLSGVNYSGCGILSFLADLVTSLLDSALGQFVIQLLEPTINNLIQGFLPNPLGIAGMTDVGKLLSGISPGTTGFMESRIVPGGFVTLNNGGMTLGLITGFNSDEDPTTRSPELDNEPALCVPPFKAPNFAAPPASLPITARSTFTLNAANEFKGMPDPAGADIALGFSETTLDLLGHHSVASGALCMGIGNSFLKQLNLGTFGIISPSLAELGTDAGTDPILLVLRPQKPLDFAIGDGTVASPNVTIGVKELEIDVYGFIYERYVRAFTMQLTLNAGINLEFEQMAGQPAKIKPTLVGLKKENITIKVLNNEFVAESKDKLEQVLPAIFDQVLPLIGSLPAFNVPSFAGFKLENLRMKKVTTSEDEFVAIFANFGASTFLKQASNGNPMLADAVDRLDNFNGGVAGPTGAARVAATLRSVVTPPPETIRAEMIKPGKGALPTITIDAPAYDAIGRPLEYSWNFNGGMWRAYQPGGQLVIRDLAFAAMQGKYEIGLISRVKGDYRTTQELPEIPVVIDSMGPRFLPKQAKWIDDELHVRGYDMVSENAVKIAFGRPGEDAPATAWQTGGSAMVTRAQADKLAVDGEIVVFLEDEMGNQTVELFKTGFHGQASGNGGCNCDSRGNPGAGNIALAVIVGLMLMMGRRRESVRKLFASRALRAAAMVVGVAVAGALVPACNCGSPGAQSCEMASDCAACPKGQLPFCIDHTCLCSDDVPVGKVGPYSDVASSASGSDVWVSAYAQSLGDLVMTKVLGPGRIADEAWEWVDGVPAVPPDVEGSKIRGGISAEGPDVGMYTSVQVANNGTPMVAYFDRDRGSLKFAAKVGASWQLHVVDAGTGPISETGGVNAGLYNSMALRSDDGRPGIAYLAHVVDAAGKRAEVRFAAAQVAMPTTAADWQIFVVDTAPIPAEDPARPDAYPLPRGLGLFVDMARQPNQAPVVAYYDRGNGELKISKFNPGTGKFSAPTVLDGGAGKDAGWSPSVAVDSQGVVKIAYVSAQQDDLMFYDVKSMGKPEVVDNGYRIVGTTSDGLAKPEFHFVGDDASLIMTATGPTIIYQDATSHELLVSQKASDNVWRRQAIAGTENPFAGAYGFFAAAAVAGNNLVVSNWVINQSAEENWVEVFNRPLVVQ
jgi:hypothetical protein